MELKILGLNIERYEFNATVELGDLNLILVGEFSVEWDDDIPLVAIDYLRCAQTDVDYLKVLDPNEIELICQEIEETGPVLDWVADKEAALCDYYYEQSRENNWDQ